MKLLVYTDGSANSAKALRFAARLTQKLKAELAVITTRPGTHAIEPLPPLGQDVALSERGALPPGLQVLTRALDVFTADGLVGRQSNIRVRELSEGYTFFCQSILGKRIPFYACFGHMIEILNREIEKHHYRLLIIAPPRKGQLHRMLMGDFSRKLVLDLHTSVLIVRGGQPNSRFLVCTDGSAATSRQFPLLKHFLPVIEPAVELIYVETPDSDEKAIKRAEHGIQQASKWLTNCGKQSKVHRLKGDRPAEIIAATAGEESVVFVGASLRHDVYRRLSGSLPIRLLARTKSSVLVAKALPEDNQVYFVDPDPC